MSSRLGARSGAACQREFVFTGRGSCSWWMFYWRRDFEYRRAVVRTELRLVSWKWKCGERRGRGVRDVTKVRSVGGLSGTRL
ncbi:Uncharacterised protein [Mycobacteroides abscessus subsp. abscessus]|uniref:hypothetical protein n=1 Tax=Mycobacteroides abscessus TaxID=36809 RepID=UPI0005E89CCC|nr:hypothetical protein [Mycobacteroides abscessus]SHP64794.1 Uncharacterised protein [Mycobacteroides abscessus subsp. bolletii]SID91149.1 Uncharacterised protein [Mycobacteroides abscessus subsp. abscessus]CPW13752.1 Uncharacterised protein [Mycobacteroides abscessus]SHS20203.1 Uncharacterised protein [Mycobacteroides abscessus subsp. bolletii]SHS85150.1 Uncharacterised protein [Mycobacteroides abscessus subsp. bolletii]